MEENQLPVEKKDSVEAECKVCQKPITFIVPPLQTFNGMLTTILCWGHDKPQVCIHCGTQYQMMFIGMQGIMLDWVPLKKQTERNIIVAPGNDNRFKVQ